MKSKLAKFLDNLFIAAAIWLLSAVITLYFLSKVYLVVIVATVVTLGISMLLNIRRKKRDESERESFNASLCMQHFLFHDDLYALDYFFDAFRTRYQVAKSTQFLKINNTLIVPYLTEPLSLKQAVYFYAEALRQNAEGLVILTYKTEELPLSITEKLDELRLEIFDANKTYRLLKSLDKLPKAEKPIKQHKVRGLLAVALSPKRAKGYLFVAFTLLFGAYFSVLSIYYIVMTAVCLTLTLICKFNIVEKLSKNKKTKNKTA